MVCPCAAARRWQWTRRRCVPFTATPSQRGCGHRRRALPSGQAAQRAEIGLAVARALCGRWSAETRTFISQLAKAKARRETTFSAEEGRAGLEDEVGGHPLLRSGEGCRNLSPGPQVRAWVGRRHSSQLGGGGGPPPRRFGSVGVFREATQRHF